MTRLTIPAPMVRFPGWREHAPDGTLLWVDVAAQRLWVLEAFVAVEVVRCSTAAAGLGERAGSFRTPRGWHAVSERIGAGLPEGAVLRGRIWTGACWTPSEGLVTADAVAVPDAAAGPGVRPGGPGAMAASGGPRSDRPDPASDLILSRVLWLEGLEAGRNRGGDVDTRRRFIYLHGTNHPEALGTPASHGCVRLACGDVIRLHERVDAGHRVWIG